MSRFDPLSPKDILIRAEHFHESLNETQISEAVASIVSEIKSKYSPVIAELLSAEIGTAALQYFDLTDEEKEDWTRLNCDEETNDTSFLADTGYDTFGTKTNGQFLLTVYHIVFHRFLTFKYGFSALLNKDQDFASLYIKNMIDPYFKGNRNQDIRYEVRYYNHRFNSVFILNSFISVLLFEYPHIINHKVRITRCKNCSNLFIPDKRSTAVYCNYPSPSNPQKTCREIGAQITWSTKEKNDIVTREYRKVYMRLKNAIKRHPENTALQAQLDTLTSNINDWREKIKNGSVTTEAFLKWLQDL